MIVANPTFEIAVMPEANIVNFRFIATELPLDQLNARIRQQLVESGKFYIVQTVIKEKRYLRVSIMNPLTTAADLLALLDEIARIGESLAQH